MYPLLVKIRLVKAGLAKIRFAALPPAVLLSLLVTGCGSADRKAQSPNAAPEEAPAVAVAKASLGDLSRKVVLTAEFIPFEEVDVMAKLSGYLKEIRVDVGDHVREGQSLATVEVPEMRDDAVRAQAMIDQAEAEVVSYRDDIRRAQAAHDIAHLSYQRLAAVVKERPGLVAQQEIDDAQSRDVTAEAQLAGANSRLAAGQQRVGVTRAELARVKTMLAYTEVTAPFTGVVTKRYANKGAMIQAGTSSATQAMPVVRLSENSVLRLILPVPESIVPLVRVGEEVTVRVPTLNRTFPGRVARFADRVQLATRTMETEVDVPNNNLTLVPGMYAEVDFTTDSRGHALTIPVTAVDLKSGSETAGKVMLVSADGRLESRDVSLGLETADKFEVLSGLAEGDSVVIGNRASLRAGQQVRPRLTDLSAPAGH